MGEKAGRAPGAADFDGFRGGRPALQVDGTVGGWQCKIGIASMRQVRDANSQMPNTPANPKPSEVPMQGYDPYSSKASHNPFDPPRSRVEDPGPDDSRRLLDDPRGVEAGRGFSWFGEGFALFRETPGAWVAAALVWLLINIALGFIPFASNLLNPVFIAGLMFGCHAQATGRGFALEHLFEGFRRNFGPLILVGLVGLAGGLAIVAIVFLSLLALGLGDAFIHQPPQEAADLAGLGLGIVLAALVALAVSIPLAMALWFAPTLVILHDLPVLQAVALSFRGCLRNLLPFLAYGIAGLGLAILATIPLGLGWLVLLPVLFTSTYAAYREIFLA